MYDDIIFGLAPIKQEGTMSVPSGIDVLPPLPCPKSIYPNGVWVGHKHYTRQEYANELIKAQKFF